MHVHTFRYFFIPYLLFLILGIMLLTIHEHGGVVLLLNEYHNAALDFFFRIWTYGGDEIIFGVIAIALLIFRRKYGYLFLLIGAVEGLISLSMKKIFFTEVPRPKTYFEGRDLLNFVDGVKVNEYGSFPSGHTMTAFAMATFLALMLAKKEWSVVLVLSAVLVGVSRIYLHHHFLIDVTVGSVIGVTVSLVLFKLFEKRLIKSKIGAN